MIEKHVKIELPDDMEVGKIVYAPDDKGVLIYFQQSNLEDEKTTVEYCGQL